MADYRYDTGMKAPDMGYNSIQDMVEGKEFASPLQDLYKVAPPTAWSPYKGVAQNLWDIARDPDHYFNQGEVGLGSQIWNHFLRSLTAGWVGSQHVSEEDYGFLADVANNLAGVAGLMPMMLGPSALLQAFRVPRHLAPFIVGAVYGSGGNTGLEFGSEEDIAARLRGAATTSLMFGAIPLAEIGLADLMVSGGLPGGLGRAAATFAERHPRLAAGTVAAPPFAALGAGAELAEGGGLKEALGGAAGGATAGFILGGARGKLPETSGQLPPWVRDARLSKEALRSARQEGTLPVPAAATEGWPEGYVPPQRPPAQTEGIPATEDFFPPEPAPIGPAVAGPAVPVIPRSDVRGLRGIIPERGIPASEDYFYDPSRPEQTGMNFTVPPGDFVPPSPQLATRGTARPGVEIPPSEDFPYVGEAYPRGAGRKPGGPPTAEEPPGPAPPERPKPEAGDAELAGEIAEVRRQIIEAEEATGEANPRLYEREAELAEELYERGLEVDESTNDIFVLKEPDTTVGKAEATRAQEKGEIKPFDVDEAIDQQVTERGKKYLVYDMGEERFVIRHRTYQRGKTDEIVLDAKKGPKGYLNVEDIRVPQGRRGKGRGSKLYQEALEFAKEKGYEGLSAEGKGIEAADARVKEFWDKHGFDYGKHKVIHQYRKEGRSPTARELKGKGEAEYLERVRELEDNMRSVDEEIATFGTENRAIEILKAMKDQGLGTLGDFKRRAKNLGTTLGGEWDWYEQLKGSPWGNAIRSRTKSGGIGIDVWFEQVKEQFGWKDFAAMAEELSSIGDSYRGKKGPSSLRTLERESDALYQDYMDVLRQTEQAHPDLYESLRKVDSAWEVEAPEGKAQVEAVVQDVAKGMEMGGKKPGGKTIELSNEWKELPEGYEVDQPDNVAYQEVEGKEYVRLRIPKPGVSFYTSAADQLKFGPLGGKGKKPGAKVPPPETPTFKLTSEWREVPEGVAIPPGAEIRMDLANEKTFARLKPGPKTTTERLRDERGSINIVPEWPFRLKEKAQARKGRKPGGAKVDLDYAGEIGQSAAVSPKAPEMVRSPAEAKMLKAKAEGASKDLLDGLVEANTEKVEQALKQFEDIEDTIKVNEWSSLQNFVNQFRGVRVALENSADAIGVPLRRTVYEPINEMLKVVGSSGQHIFNHAAENIFRPSGAFRRGPAGKKTRRILTNLMWGVDAKSIEARFGRAPTEAEVTAAKKLRILMGEKPGEGLHGFFELGEKFIQEYYPRARDLQEIWNKYKKVGYEKLSDTEKKVIDDVENNGSLHVMFQGSIPKEIRWAHELERTGQLDLLEEDAVKLFESYVRGGLRKKYLQPVWDQIKQRHGWESKERFSGRWEEGTFNNLGDYEGRYVQGYVKHVLGFPSATENALNSLLWKSIEQMNKMLPKEKHIRPGGVTVQKLSRKIADMVYLGGLGFRLGSAAKNLTQSTLTSGEIGVRWAKEGMRLAATKEGRQAVQDADIFTDFAPSYEKELSLSKGALRKFTDAGLWFFGQADRVNRTIAYLGAREKVLKLAPDGKFNTKGIRFETRRKIQQALDKGNVQEAAHLYGKYVVAETQYLYTKANTPMAFRNSVGRLFGQFMTWPLYFSELGFKWLTGPGSGFNMDRTNAAQLLNFTLAMGAAAYGAKALGYDIGHWFMFGAIPSDIGGPTWSATTGFTKGALLRAQLAQAEALGSDRWADHLKKEIARTEGNLKSDLRVFIPGMSAVREFDRAYNDIMEGRIPIPLPKAKEPASPKEQREKFKAQRGRPKREGRKPGR